jgi:hypothetical protein
MNKVSPDFLPNTAEGHHKELLTLLEARGLEYSHALAQGNLELADRIDEEAKHLMTELRMTDPQFELTDLEQFLKWQAEQLTLMQHDQLNRESK